MTYTAPTFTAGQPALAADIQAMANAVARIDTTISPVAATVYTTSTGNISSGDTGTGNFPAGRYYAVFNTVERDTSGMVNLGGGGNSNKIITITVSGLYLLFGMGSFSNNATGYREISIDKAGDPTQIQCIYQISPVSGTNTFLTVSGMQYMNAGDTLALRMGQNSGATLTTTSISGAHLKMGVARISS